MKRLDFDDHSDQRGFVVNPFEGLCDTGCVTNCHAFSIHPGCLRGGHAHGDRNEKVLVLSGGIAVVTEGLEECFHAPAFFEIGPGEHHSFRCLGDLPAAVLCWSDSFPDLPDQLSG